VVPSPMNAATVKVSNDPNSNRTGDPTARFCEC